MFAVIVLDEFEKAAGNIYQRFLQVFDEGLLINGNDEQVNLRNAIFILTSNFGARLIEHGRLGFAANETVEARERRVLSETEAYFTPEFMNRMDAVCIFHPLNRAIMADIARREIGDLLRRDGILRRKVDVEIDDEVIDHVVALGYSPHYGARYLKRQIEKIITYPVARELNARPAGEAGGSIRLYLKQGRVASAFLTSAAAQPAPAGAAEAGSGLPAPVGMDEMRAALPVLAARVEALEEAHGAAAAEETRSSILAEMADVRFWDDAAAARRKLDTYQQASSTIEELSSLRRALDTLTAGLSSARPVLENVTRAYKYLVGELPRLEITSWLSGPYDAGGAYVLISARGKAAAARQWAASLARMYLGWARQRRLTAAVIGEHHSPEGRSVMLALGISGFGVYGLLQGERGTHRLVQTVKVDGRETLQRLAASVQVLPELGDDVLPAAPDLQVHVRATARSGLLLNRLTAQASARLANGDRRLTLAGDLPADDLGAEVSRMMRILRLVAAEQPEAGGGELVRSYVRSTKDKGVHDHGTGLRAARVKQVLEGEIQPFLDERLRKTRSMIAPVPLP
jgi:protein subunit release factor B